MIFISYYLIILIISLESLKSGKKKEFNYLVLFLFFSCLLAFTSGLRYEWGIDYENYKNLYEYETVVNSVEVVYFYMSYFLHKIGLDYNLFLLFLALFSIWGKLHFYYKWSTNSIFIIIPYLSLTYSIYELGFVRQAFALTFICFSFDSYFSHKKKLSYFFALLAILSQMSVFVIFLVYFLDKLLPQKHKVKNITIIFLAIYAFVFSNLIPMLVLNLVSGLSGDIYVIGKIIFYLNEYPGTGLSLNVVRAFFMLLLFNSKCKNRQLLRLYNIGILIYISFTCNAQFATRFYTVPCILEPLLIDDILKQIPCKKQFWAKTIFAGMYIVLFVYNILLFNYWNYKSILSSL